MILISLLHAAQCAPPEKRKARMNAFTGMVQIICVIVPLLSCATASAHTHIFGMEHAHTTHFGSGQVPAVTVYGFGGQVLQWKLYNIGTGAEVRNGSSLVPYAASWTVWFPDLSPGTYQCAFLINGVSQTKVLFQVTG